jgi:hypothetical protein
MHSRVLLISELVIQWIIPELLAIWVGCAQLRTVWIDVRTSCPYNLGTFQWDSGYDTQHSHIIHINGQGESVSLWLRKLKS